jgi:hypothetical protein
MDELSRRSKLLREYQQNIRPVAKLRYRGPIDPAGQISIESEVDWSLCFAEIVLADTVGGWEEFLDEDYKWHYWLVSRNELLLRIDFRNLQRKDNTFVFSFDLRDEHHREWLAFLVKSKNLAIVNGPMASSMLSICIRIESGQFVEDLRHAVQVIQK